MTLPAASPDAPGVPSWRSRAPRLALACALAAVIVMAVFGQTRLYFDYAWQLMSVRDYARGDSPSPFLIRFADSADLAQDRLDWTIGYPLSYNALGGALTRLGVTPAAAHRTIAAGAVIAGILGLYLLLRDAVRVSPLARAVALLTLSLSFNGLHMVCFMMPEVFLFATVPWQLWALHQALQPEATPRRRLAMLLLLGAMTGLSYTFRYLAPLSGLPLLACAAGWLAWRRPARWLAGVVGLAVAAALPVAIMSGANYLHTGAINSTSSSLPWGMTPHWPSLNQWLLAITGPVQALFGSAFVYGRAAAQLGSFADLTPFDAQQRWGLLLAIIPTLLGALLIARFARRSPTLLFALAGVAGTSGGLLWLYSRSEIPQTDPRYFAAPALLIFPALLEATLAAWRQSRRWRVAVAIFVFPLALSLVYAGYACLRNLRAPEFGGRGGIMTEGGVNPATLRAAVAAHPSAGSREIVWMCFQPGVLHALDGRHAFESYQRAPVEYRASRPVTLVVLRDRHGGMHPSIYAANFHHLDILSRPPDFAHGAYDVYVRPIGPQGLLRDSAPARP